MFNPKPTSLQNMLLDNIVEADNLVQHEAVHHMMYRTPLGVKLFKHELAKLSVTWRIGYYFASLVAMVTNNAIVTGCMYVMYLVLVSTPNVAV